MSTIFQSDGVKTSIYEFPLELGKTDTRILDTELILSHPVLYGNFLASLDQKYDDVYIGINAWSVYNKLPRANGMVDFSHFESSPNFTVIVSDDSFLFRVYKYVTKI